MFDDRLESLENEVSSVNASDDEKCTRKATSYNSSFTAKPVYESPNSDISQSGIGKLDAAETKTARSRAQSIALIGMSIAITAVCAWISIPLGPIPFTMQMFAVTFFICILTPSEAIATVFGYILIGAVGVPVFSGMRGGIGVLMGPTGGFLLGYLLGVTVAALFLYVVNHVFASKIGTRSSKVSPEEWAKLNVWQKVARNLAPCGIDIVAGFIFVLIAYVTGWAQYMLVTNVGPTAAFVACVAPFIVGDVVKVILAALCAQSVKAVINR